MPSYRAFPSTNGPSTATAYTGGYVAGQIFTTLAATWFKGFWWWCCASGQSTASVKACLYQVLNGGGQASGGLPVGATYLVPNTTVTSRTLTAGAWNWIPLAQPVALSPGFVYMAALGMTNAFPDTPSYWGASGTAPNGITNGPLMMYSDNFASGYGYQNGFTGGQSTFSTAGSDPTTTVPFSSNASFNSWVDVEVTDTDPQIPGATYRLWPTGVPGSSVDDHTGDDAVANFVLATEIHLTQSCLVHNIWWFSNNGSGGAILPTVLPTDASIWSIDNGDLTGTRVFQAATPSWSGAAGSGWVSTPVNQTLPAGRYKVSVYYHGTPASYSSTRYGYWQPRLIPPATQGYAAPWAPAANGINFGPLYAPNSSSAALNYSYGNAGTTGTHVAGDPTENAQGSFNTGPNNADPGNVYPNVVVGTGSASPGPTYETFWVDMEVSPSTTPVADHYRIFQAGPIADNAPVTQGATTAGNYTGTFISGVVFTVLENAWFEGYWWWVAANQSTSPVKCALWSQTNGTLSLGGANPAEAVVPGSVVTSGTLSPGWNYIPLTQPVQISILDSLVAAIGCNGNFPDTPGWWAANATNGIKNGPLFAFGPGISSGGGTSYYSGGSADPNGTPQGCFNASGSTDPSVSFAGGASGTDNFWVDVQVTTTPPAGYTGSYRLYPNRQGADAMTSLDAAAAYVTGTEFHLSQACTVNNIWCYSNHGAPHLPAAVDIWSIGTPQTGGTNLHHDGSPTWLNASGSAATAGQGWIKAAVSGLTLPAGSYRVTVYDQSGASGSSTSKRLSYWGLDMNSGDGYVNQSQVGQFGITNGPLSAPQTAAASIAYSYGNGSANGPNGQNYNNATEPGQSVFFVGDGTTSLTTGDGYPNQYVGTHSPTTGNIYQNYWVDVEVTPAGGPGHGGSFLSLFR